MNIFDICNYKVIVDFGHNPAAVEALSVVHPHLATGKVIGMHSGTGNRLDENIILYGRTLGRIYDHIVLTDSDVRGRPVGEVAGLVKKGILETGFPEENITLVLDSREATKTALKMAEAGDLVVLQADHLEQMLEDVFAYKECMAKQRE